MSTRVWRGTWSSKVYSADHVSGTIEVLLPAPFDPNAVTMTMAALEYTGVYRNGARVILHLTGQNSAGTSQQDVPVSPGKKMVLVEQTQNITFTCELASPTSITGTYQTSNPRDNGTFTLTPTEATLLDTRTSNPNLLGSCSVM